LLLLKIICSVHIGVHGSGSSFLLIQPFHTPHFFFCNKDVTLESTDCDWVRQFVKFHQMQTREYLSYNLALTIRSERVRIRTERPPIYIKSDSLVN